MDTTLPYGALLSNDTIEDLEQCSPMGTEHPPAITGKQCRMARAALRWKVRDLAKRAGMGPGTIVRIENDSTSPKPNASSFAALKAVFEAAGVEFIGTDTVRLSFDVPPVEDDPSS